MRCFLIVVMIICSLSVHSRECVTVLYNESTAERLVATDFKAETEDEQMIHPIFHPVDTTYYFNDLPAGDVVFTYILADSPFSVRLSDVADTVFIPVSPLLLVHELGTVTVQGATQYVTDGKSVFIPTKAQKKSSGNGADLIVRMAVPSLKVDMMDQSIKTSSGANVSLFINYLPATSREVADLRTSDVVRVEQYDFSTDPRFAGADHVVNFVMERYEYGGYGKMYGEQGIVNDRGRYIPSLRLSYKNMEYSISGGCMYINSDYDGSDAFTEYFFPDEHMEKKMTLLDSRSRLNVYFTTLRFIYNEDKISVSNSVGINSIKQPDCMRRMMTEFSDCASENEKETEKSKESQFSPSWEGYLRWTIADDLSFVANTSVSYSDSRRDYDYFYGENGYASLFSSKSWNGAVNILLQKKIGRHSVMLTTNGSARGNNLSFYSDQPVETMTHTRCLSGSVGLGGSFVLGPFRAKGSVFCLANRDEVNTMSRTDIHPKYYVNMSYYFDKASITASSQLFYSGVKMSQLSNVKQRLNRLDAISGNPGLKPYRFSYHDVTFSWFPAQIFSLSANVGFMRQDEPIVYNYEPTEMADQLVMLRTYMNKGYVNSLSYNLQASIRLFDNSLTIMGGMDGNTVSRNTVNRYRKTSVQFNCQLQYLLKDFWLQAYYNNRGREVTGDLVVVAPEYYSLTLGWGNGDWNIRAKAINFFNSRWNDSRSSIISDRYVAIIQNYSSSYHRSFEINVIYSFSFGKKTRQEDMPGQMRGAESGILK